MIYDAVGNRCAVDFADLQLTIPPDECLEILKQKGFGEIKVNLVELARKCIGVSKYRRGARLDEAPQMFDCSSFIKWLYGQKSIWLPRRGIQQREFGIPVNRKEIKAEDIVFVSGYIDYYFTDQKDGVGHVGIATGEGTIIHAANGKLGVIESSFEDFVSKGFRGIRRIVPDGHLVHTLITPIKREVEWSDDIRWIILQKPRK